MMKNVTTVIPNMVGIASSSLLIIYPNIRNANKHYSGTAILAVFPTGFKPVPLTARQRVSTIYKNSGRSCRYPAD